MERIRRVVTSWLESLALVAIPALATALFSCTAIFATVLLISTSCAGNSLITNHLAASNQRNGSATLTPE
jgi:hypothetical protein